MKKWGIILLSASLLLFCSIPSFASNKPIDKAPAESGSIATNAEELENLKLQNFTSYIGWFFENPDLYHAINMEGDDISKEYYDNNIDYYRVGDFETLMKNTEGIISSFDKYQSDVKNNISSEVVPLASISKSASKTFCCLFSNSITDLEAYVKVVGNYQVDIANGNVTSASSPTISLTDYQGSDLGAVTMSIISRSYLIQNGGSSVKFSGVVDLYGYTGGIVTYYGRYVMSITGNRNGLVSYSPSDGYVYP